MEEWRFPIAPKRSLTYPIGWQCARIIGLLPAACGESYEYSGGYGCGDWEDGKVRREGSSFSLLQTKTRQYATITNSEISLLW